MFAVKFFHKLISSTQALDLNPAGSQVSDKFNSPRIYPWEKRTRKLNNRFIGFCKTNTMAKPNISDYMLNSTFTKTVKTVITIAVCCYAHG
jgi:hypothetical protein